MATPWGSSPYNLALSRLLASSRFVKTWDSDYPGQLADVLLLLEAQKGQQGAAAEQLLRLALTDIQKSPDVARRVRQFRRIEMVRIAANAIAKNASLDETLAALSSLAEVCCSIAIELAMMELVKRFGTPRSSNGVESRPIVLAMGKLGGRELNFSSDIDLVFAFTVSGETDGKASISNEEFFTRAAQNVIRFLSEYTADGFVFRVDTLLRPFGSVGALAHSTAAMETYYETHGREWERYALIKARPVAGDLVAGRVLLQRLRPFIYRRYLDFGALGNLRELKRSIDLDAGKRGAEENLKLGPGGIRELEFIVQLFQLMRGGQDSRLRNTALRPTLRYLGTSDQLPSETADQLDAAYVFLRRCENAIQMYADEQTHQIPKTEERRLALCAALDFPTWELLLRELEIHRSLVRAEFARIFAPPRLGDGARRKETSVASSSTADRGQALKDLGFRTKTLEVANAVTALLSSRLVRGLGEKSRQRLEHIVDWLISAATTLPDPDTALLRVLQVLSALAGRGTYIALLFESESARQQLIRLAAASPWIAELLARNPALLDALLDARIAADVPDRSGFVAELANRTNALDGGDIEGQLGLLRRFRQEMMLRIASADLAGLLPLAEVSNRLTWLAETIVTQAVDFARDQPAHRTRDLEQSAPAPFAVIGYGKFGSLELGYGSDLDLVFVYDEDRTIGTMDVARAGAAPFTDFARLAQRIVMLLSALTSAGRAYEVDLQLRPSGNSGLVVASLTGFARYQQESAWTWEHQALLRARVITGDATLTRAIEAVRREVLARPRDPQKLTGEVRAMRTKMRAALEKRLDGKWDVKQGDGGLIDAEFLTQYLCLRHASQNPALIDYTDNWRQLEALAAVGLIETVDRDALLAAERTFRGYLHRRALQQQDGMADEAQFADERAAVSARWKHYLENPAL